MGEPASRAGPEYGPQAAVATGLTELGKASVDGGIGVRNEGE